MQHGATSFPCGYCIRRPPGHRQAGSHAVLADYGRKKSTSDGRGHSGLQELSHSAANLPRLAHRDNVEKKPTVYLELAVG